MRPVLTGVAVAVGLAAAGGCRSSGEPSGAESSLRVSSEKGAGGRIAFSDDVKYVYVINADSSGLTKPTSHPGNDFDPSWSPDGRADCVQVRT